MTDINKRHQHIASKSPAFPAIHEVNVIVDVRLWIGRTHSLYLVTARFLSPR